MAYPKQDRAERFWNKVCRTSRCWLWTAAKLNGGYGAFQDEGRTLRAHRVSWELAYGSIPCGIQVLHHCDNPACVRPDHLFLGTGKDNMKDRDTKGRQACGDRHGSRLHPERRPRGVQHYSRARPDLVPRGDRSGQAKLTSVQVAHIRREYIPYKVSYTALAKKYGVHPETIGRIIRRENWCASSSVVT